MIINKLWSKCFPENWVFVFSFLLSSHVNTVLGKWPETRNKDQRLKILAILMKIGVWLPAHILDGSELPVTPRNPVPCSDPHQCPHTHELCTHFHISKNK